jgi:hypothetical protein
MAGLTPAITSNGHYGSKVRMPGTNKAGHDE